MSYNRITLRINSETNKKMEKTRKVLYVASKNRMLTDLIQEYFKGTGIEFGYVYTAEEAEREFSGGDYNGVFFETLRIGKSSLDDYCRGGLDLVASACEIGLPVMVISGAGADILEKAGKLGARTLPKPLQFSKLPRIAREVFDARD